MSGHPPRADNGGASRTLSVDSKHSGAERPSSASAGDDRTLDRFRVTAEALRAVTRLRGQTLPAVELRTARMMTLPLMAHVARRTVVYFVPGDPDSEHENGSPTCLQVLAGYAVGFTAAGWVSLATPDAALSSILFPVSAIFGFWALSVMFSLNRVAPFIRGFGDSDNGDGVTVCDRRGGMAMIARVIVIPGPLVGYVRAGLQWRLGGNRRRAGRCCEPL